MQRVLILAIDTSTEQAGLALLNGRNPRAEWSWTAAGNHSQHLDRLLRSLLDTERIQPRELEALVVASGPGSFSGLRVGVSFAKGLALALGTPLIGVGTLDAIGFAGCFLSQDVLATLPAGREQLYVGRYGRQNECFVRISDYAIMLPSEAAALANPETMLCGPGSEAVAEALVRDGQPAKLQPSEWSLRRPGFLAELGRRRLAEGVADQVHTLEPLYLRRSAAEEKRLARQE
jgi:tRNA threonylcarbamoyladenosine biosynthesis protein TsaB